MGGCRGLLSRYGSIKVTLKGTVEIDEIYIDGMSCKSKLDIAINLALGKTTVEHMMVRDSDER